MKKTDTYLKIICFQKIVEKLVLISGLCHDIELMHSGSYIYQGKIVDMANVGVHATLDPEHAQKILDKIKTDKS